MTAANRNPQPVSQTERIAACLAALDPTTAAPDPQLIDMAVAFVAENLTCEQLWLPWAQYAYRAVRQLPNPGRERMVGAVRAYASALGVNGRHEHAARVCQELLDGIAQQPPDDVQVRVRIDLAASLHAAGRCGQAVREIGSALNTARTYHPQERLLRITCTAAYLAMLVACGRLAEAAAVRRAAHTWLPAAFTPGSVTFGLLATVNVPEVGEHDAVCAANLDTLLAEPDAPPTPSPSRLSLRELLVRFGVANNPGWPASFSPERRPRP